MTNAEIRALLHRVDPRQLREDAGIAPRTVQRALGMHRNDLSRWERGRHVPQSEAGIRWAKFTAGLERHAAVTAEIAATERSAAA